MKYNKSFHVPLDTDELKSTKEEMKEFEEELSEVGATLKELREEWGMTQAEVAKRVRIDETLLAEIEKGTQLPSQETAEKLGRLFHVDWKNFV